MDKADDYISLIIAVMAVLYSIFTVLRSIYGPEKPPKPHDFEEEEEEDEEDEYEEHFEPIKVKAAPPAPAMQKRIEPVAAKKPFEFHSQLEDMKSQTAIDDRHLEIHLRPGSELCSDAFRLAQTEGAVMKRPVKPSIRQLIKSLPEEQLLFLSYEVFHVPVSKRSSPFPWNG